MCLKLFTLTLCLVVTFDCLYSYPTRVSHPRRRTSSSTRTSTSYRKSQSKSLKPSKALPTPKFTKPQHNKVIKSAIDAFYVEQRPMQDEDETSDTSDLHPIYVLPPPDFQPVIYPNSRMDGVKPGMRSFAGNHKQITLTPPPRPYPYPYPHGFSSWVFGGIRPIQRGSYWEQLSSDMALHNPFMRPVAHHSTHPNQIVYLTRPMPLGVSSWGLEGMQRVHPEGKWQDDSQQHQVPAVSNSIAPTLKSKLPVGVSSWLLGGMRDLSGRHWEMPSDLVEQVEFMPKASNGKPISEDEKKKNEYIPTGVQFDDEAEISNVIKR